MKNIFFGISALFLRDHRHRHPVESGNTAYDRRIVPVVSVPVEFCKIRKQRTDIITAGRPVAFSGFLYPFPCLYTFFSFFFCSAVCFFDAFFFIRLFRRRFLGDIFRHLLLFMKLYDPGQGFLLCLSFHDPVQKTVLQ